MADVTISGLGNLAVSSELLLPVSNSSTTGKLTIGDINSLVTKTSIGLGNVENKSSATIRGELTSTNVTTALNFTPYNNTNPSGFITSSSLPASQQLPRAWVSFNGFNNTSNINSITNTNRFIRSSYNVSSVLRNGQGDYTINFSPALPDNNYIALFGESRQNGNNSCHPYIVYVNGSPLLKSSNQLRIYNSRAFADNVEDSFEINVMVFR
jgi:hypothetical protein